MASYQKKGNAHQGWM